MPIQDSLKEDIWPSEAVQAVLASKADKREQKGRNLAAYSLDLSGGAAASNATLERFVDLSYEAVKQSGQAQRFQLAVKTSAVHWTTLDVIVTPEQGIKMINIDAAGDSLAIVKCSSMYEAFKKKYPAEANADSRLFFLKHDRVPGTEKQRQVQYDRTSCSRFALDTLFHLSNIDAIPLLEAKKAKFAKSIFSEGEYGFNATNMPVEMASVFRDTQSKTAFESLPSALRKHVINKKGETLSASEAHHTEVVTTPDATKPVNKAIEHKRAGFVADAEQFLATNPRALEIIENRDAMKALERGQFLAKPRVHAETVVGHLINEATRIESQKEPASGCMSRIKHSLNERHITSAARELEAGRPIAALTQLEKMKGITREYKHQIAEVKEEISQEPTRATTSSPTK